MPPTAPPTPPLRQRTALLRELAARHGTPLYVQDLDGLAARVARLGAFDVVRYAMKANPGLALLGAMRRAGARVDCVSEGELARALAAGWSPEEITFTSDLFDRRTLPAVAAAGVEVNLGSPDMIEQYAAAGPRRGVTLRVNPGFGHGHNRRVNTGGTGSKHGIWHGELGEAVARARRAGLEVTGLHMHIGSGTDLEHLRRVAGAMVRVVEEVGASVRTISAGGGLPVPYRPTDPELDVDALAEVWGDARAEIEGRLGHPVTLEVEPGRYLVAQDGVMVAEVRGVKAVGPLPWVLVDAGFHNLARPMLYGAHHGLHVLGAEGRPVRPTVVAGPLCESSDVFTQDAGGEVVPRDLAECAVGDLLCFHDTGAYGASMASGYNSMAIAPEVVIEGGSPRLARPRRGPDEDLARELGLLER